MENMTNEQVAAEWNRLQDVAAQIVASVHGVAHKGFAQTREAVRAEIIRRGILTDEQTCSGGRA